MRDASAASQLPEGRFDEHPNMFGFEAPATADGHVQTERYDSLTPLGSRQSSASAVWARMKTAALSPAARYARQYLRGVDVAATTEEAASSDPEHGSGRVVYEMPFAYGLGGFFEPDDHYAADHRRSYGYTASSRPFSANSGRTAGPAWTAANAAVEGSTTSNLGMHGYYGRHAVGSDETDSTPQNSSDASYQKDELAKEARLAGLEAEEEDSPFPEVRASVSNVDDPDMPVLTFRAWFLGVFFVIAGSWLNFFFTVRWPSALVSPVTVQVLSYPLGKALAAVLPITAWSTPVVLRRMGFPEELSFNPGPFNIKEHTVIVMMANVCLNPAYALSVTIAMDKFYGQPKGIGFDFLIVLATQVVGFSFAGMCRRFLVWPASVIWPQNLVTCTLLNTLHAEDEELDGSKRSLTRFRYFAYVSVGAFVWYFLPGYLWTGLSTFSFICWIWPRRPVVNQLFGISTGLGMSMVTFDWGPITYIGSPLVVPWYAAVNIFVGFVILYWLTVPILYYTNAWSFAYMPISALGNFDRYGAPYDVSMVINPDLTFNQTLYRQYSPLFLSTTYTMVYAISFCLATAAITHTLLFHGKDIVNKVKGVLTEPEDIHMKLMRSYPEVPGVWYLSILVVFAAIGIAAIEIYDTEMSVWGLLLALLVPALYMLPGGFVFSVAAQIITTNLISEVIAGYAMPGKPLANMLFKAFSIQALQAGLYFVQDLKVGHYMKIPPRATFLAQTLSIVVACFAQVGMKKALEVLASDLCSPTQKARLVCPLANVTFEASIIWGLIGPQRFFGTGSQYRPLPYLLLVGALLPIPFFLAARRWPKSRWRLVNIPILLNGVTWIPPVSGVTYASWFIVSFIFQFWLRRKRFPWWSKFSFITSGALETGTVLSGLFIFFVLQLPRNGNINVKWWGNEVYKNTDDWDGTPLKSPPSSGFGPTAWQ